MPLAAGTTAPDFTLKTLSSTGLGDVSLSATYAEKNVVLLFFPGAFTSVCEQELCDVSSGLSAYNDLNAQVFGISQDSPFALTAWASQKGISFPLLSDWGGKVTEAYDVVFPDFAGLGPGTARASFVIDKNGVIVYAEQTPTLRDLPDFAAILAALEKAAL